MFFPRQSSALLQKLPLVLLGSLIYMTLHLVNIWVFGVWEVTQNISWIYLPSFIRLANLLILGPLWGTVATGLGGAELILLSDQTLNGLAWLNDLASCSSAVAAYGLFVGVFRRPVALTQFKDLLLLSIIYTLINPSLHFVLWQFLYASSPKPLHDFVAMAVGDLLGVIVGALLFVWTVRSTGLAQWVARKLRQ
jgi:hypothetical protein